MSQTAILSIIQQDYQTFPNGQDYSIYDEKVYFKDPFNEFTGVAQYQKMIGFIRQWFIDIQLDLHSIQQQGQTIETRWTLSWTAPTPWKPRMSIPGWSELTLNEAGLITSHIDYWECSRWDVLKQFLGGGKGASKHRS